MQRPRQVCDSGGIGGECAPRRRRHRAARLPCRIPREALRGAGMQSLSASSPDAGNACGRGFSSIVLSRYGRRRARRRTEFRAGLRRIEGAFGAHPMRFRLSRAKQDR
jgi:hypothetical protein